jgi:hypothetical protein
MLHANVAVVFIWLVCRRKRNYKNALCNWLEQEVLVTPVLSPPDFHPYLSSLPFSKPRANRISISRPSQSPCVFPHLPRLSLPSVNCHLYHCRLCRTNLAFTLSRSFQLLGAEERTQSWWILRIKRQILQHANPVRAHGARLVFVGKLEASLRFSTKRTATYLNITWLNSSSAW